jgi:hypothetical protein
MDEALKDYLNKVGPMQLGLDVAANKNYSMVSYNRIFLRKSIIVAKFRPCVWQLEGGECNYYLG